MSYPGVKDIIGAITEGMQEKVPYEDILLNVINLAQLQLEDLRDQQRGDRYFTSIPEFLVSLGMDRILLDMGEDSWGMKKEGAYIPITEDTYGYSSASKLKAIYGEVRIYSGDNRSYVSLRTNLWKKPGYTYMDIDQVEKIAKYIKANSMGTSHDRRNSYTYYYLIAGDLIMILRVHKNEKYYPFIMTKDAFSDAVTVSVHAGKDTVSMGVDMVYGEMDVSIPQAMTPVIRAWLQGKPLPLTVD